MGWVGEDLPKLRDPTAISSHQAGCGASGPEKTESGVPWLAEPFPDRPLQLAMPIRVTLFCPKKMEKIAHPPGQVCQLCGMLR